MTWLGLVVGLIGLTAVAPLHRWLTGWLSQAGALFTAHPVLGAAIFIGLSALSAMIAFFSSTVLVPAGLAAWSPVVCLVLLWIGWVAGGVIAYTVARVFGRRVFGWSDLPRGLAALETRIGARTSFGVALLLQLAVPSELPGYLFGLTRFPFLKYLAALALAELPYAVATVFASSAFLERRLVPLVILVVAAAVLGTAALRRLHHHLPVKSPVSD